MKKNGILLLVLFVTAAFTGFGFLTGEFFKQSTAENTEETVIANDLVLEPQITSDDEVKQEYYDIEIKN